MNATQDGYTTGDPLTGTDAALPLTGMDIWMLVIVACVLILVGIAMRHLTQEGS